MDLGLGVLVARLEQRDPRVGILAQARGEHAAGRAGADDHVVKSIIRQITTFITSVGLLIAKRSASGARSSGNSWLISGARSDGVALDDPHRLAELAAAAAADAEQIELLLGQAADPERHLVARHADLHGTPRRGDHLDHRADGGGHAGGVEHHRRAAAARPAPRPPQAPRPG